MSEGFYLGINDIIINDTSVRIDFKSDAAPVIDVGASVEGSIIDILAQSILDNLPQYKSIYISIEGGPYHSGHLELNWMRYILEGKHGRLVLTFLCIFKTLNKSKLRESI